MSQFWILIGHNVANSIVSLLDEVSFRIITNWWLVVLPVLTLLLQATGHWLIFIRWLSPLEFFSWDRVICWLILFPPLTIFLQATLNRLIPFR